MRLGSLSPTTMILRWINRPYGENMKKLFTLLFPLITLILVSCGYKPSSHYIKKTFEDTVYVDVIVDRVEPENAPFIKDEMNRLVYNRFKGRVTTKEQAGSEVFVSHTRVVHLRH